MTIIKKDKVVSLTYQLRLNSKSGDVVESLNEDSPLTFLFGRGSLLPRFEENIEGLEVGENFDFDLPCEDAYGTLNEDAIVEVPKMAFEVNGKIDESLLQLGNTIPMQDSDGNKLNGIVKGINGDSVTMDFNHPLAGSHLYFTGKVTSIREATEDELHHGHAHYEGGCNGCEHCGGEGDHKGCC